MSMDSSSQKSTTFFNTNFCLQLAYKVLQKQVERGLNFVSSPLSLHIILSIIAAGSSGETLKQLLSFLGSESINDLNSLSSEIVSRIRLVEDNNEGGGGPVISFVNGTWVEKSFGLKTSFEEIVKHLYKSKIEAVDFIHKAYQVKDEVNSWVENATNGLIKQLLPPGSLDEETKLVLVNALYFKGSWDQKFNPSKTLPKNFQLLNCQMVKVPFMTGVRNDEYYYKSFENFKMLKIPYQSGNTTTTSLKFSMYFFLPHHNNINNNEGLPNLIHTFNSNPKFLNQNFGLYREDLEELWIPRFKFSSDFDAVADMRDLGLTLPFRPGDLTEISDSSLGESLYVSNILHKAFIEVNEEGTEAAASTVAILRLYNCGGMVHFHRPSFVADHPFLFMIREEKSRAVFFIGAVLNPLLDS